MRSTDQYQAVVSPYFSWNPSARQLLDETVVDVRYGVLDNDNVIFSPFTFERGTGCMKEIKPLNSTTKDFCQNFEICGFLP